MKEEIARLEGKKLKKATIDLDKLEAGKSETILWGDKEYLITLTAVKKNRKPRRKPAIEEEFPGYGLLGNVKITEEDIEEAKKSLFKNIEL